MANSDLITTREAAELLGFHPETVRQYAKEGRIPAIRMRRRWRFRRSSIEAWLDGREQGGRHLRVLVVEDETAVLEPVCMALRDVGYHVTAATSGQEAVDCMQGAAPDIAILDLRLPGISGVDVMRELTRQCPAAKVIIVTGYPDSKLMHQALQVAPVTMLAKPVHPETLLKTIEGVIRPGPRPQA